MKKNCLMIGVSICAVVLLVLGSLTNVVGYQSVKSTAMSESPLFSIRTQKAINKESNVLTSDYLGKGYHSLSFPLRDNNNAEIEKFVDKIRTMDESSFNRFVKYVVNQIYYKNNLKGIDVKELINELRQLRESRQNIIVYKDSNNERKTYFYNFYPTACWFPGCIVVTIIMIIFIIIILSSYHPTTLGCSPPV